MSSWFVFWRHFIRFGSGSTCCLFPVLLIVVTFSAHYTEAQQLENCSSARDCVGNYTSWACCAGVCLQRIGCLGIQCNDASDCSDAEICCINSCQLESNCLELSCSFDADCPSNEVCCFGTCSDYCPNLIHVILISAVAFFLFVFAYCFACKKVLSRNQYGYIVDNDRTTITRPPSWEISFSTSSQETTPSPSFTKGLTRSYQHKFSWYPPVVSLFAPRGVGSHRCYAERKEVVESRKNNAIISSYGATG